MKHQVVAIRDRAINAYGRPAFVPSLGQAIRSFADEVNNATTENIVYKHPDDFELYHLGNYDEDTGQFENLLQPSKIADGKNLKIRKE